MTISKTFSGRVWRYFRNVFPWIVGAQILAGIPILLIFVMSKIANKEAFNNLVNNPAQSYLLVGLSSIWIIGISLWVIKIRSDNINSKNTQSWLIDAVNWNVARLKAHGLCRLPESETTFDSIESPLRWPWGNHHTEYLGHLEAAARKWWTLYDPDDPTTAPTNEIVSDWLQSERKLSKERSKAIASMLRPDGLPTGPRK